MTDKQTKNKTIVDWTMGAVVHHCTHIFYLYFYNSPSLTCILRTIHAQYTHYTRTIPIGYLKDSKPIPNTIEYYYEKIFYPSLINLSFLRSLHQPLCNLWWRSMCMPRTRSWEYHLLYRIRRNYRQPRAWLLGSSVLRIKRLEINSQC